MFNFITDIHLNQLSDVVETQFNVKCFGYCIHKISHTNLKHCEFVAIELKIHPRGPDVMFSISFPVLQPYIKSWIIATMCSTKSKE